MAIIIRRSGLRLLVAAAPILVLVCVHLIASSTQAQTPVSPAATSTGDASATPGATLTATLEATQTVVAKPVLRIYKGSGLPERPATRLVIPAMKVDAPVVLVPIVSRTWKLDELGTDKVGHLEGTASPGSSSNVVLAAHVTTAHLVYGPFAGLGLMQPGDAIIVYVGDESYAYRVDYLRLVERADIKVVYPTETGQVTLITCNNWSDDLKTYQERLIVVGHLEAEPTAPVRPSPSPGAY